MLLCSLRASEADVRRLYVDSVTAFDFDAEAKQPQDPLQEARQEAASLQVMSSDHGAYHCHCVHCI